MDVPRPRRHPKAAPAQLAFVEDERARWAEHDACFSPRPVVRQILLRLRDRFPNLVGGRVIDLGAGAGVWCSEARDILRPELVLAVEPREEERVHLERHADIVMAVTAQRACETWNDLPEAGFDLALGNPPWWCWPEIWAAGWSVLKATGVQSFLGPSAWGHSHETGEGRQVFEEAAPLEQWRIARRVAYNGGRSTDNRKCSAWVWYRSNSGTLANGWLAHQLPDMGPNAYHWDERPGTET